MSTPIKKFYSNSMENTPVRYVKTIDQQSMAADATHYFLAPFDFRFEAIGQVWMQAAQRGIDATDPLTVDLEVTINGVTIFATKPQIAQLAGGGAASTLAAATGVTVGALSATAANLEGSKGDVIGVTFDLTETTPDTDPANFRACIILHELADYDQDLNTARTES